MGIKFSNTKKRISLDSSKAHPKHNNLGPYCCISIPSTEDKSLITITITITIAILLQRLLCAIILIEIIPHSSLPATKMLLSRIVIIDHAAH